MVKWLISLVIKNAFYAIRLTIQELVKFIVYLVKPLVKTVCAPFKLLKKRKSKKRRCK